jgi:DNA-nicking Smr family endonuclease
VIESEMPKPRKGPQAIDHSAPAENNPFPEPIVLPLADVLDLHAFQPKEIASVVEEYLIECQQAGFAAVRIIHGKGIGAQRNRVRALLEKHLGVVSFRDAPPEAGGWGATLVLLKQKS